MQSALFCLSACLITLAVQAAPTLSPALNPVHDRQLHPAFNPSLNPQHNLSINPRHNLSLNPWRHPGLRLRWAQRPEWKLRSPTGKLLSSMTMVNPGFALTFSPQGQWVGYAVSNQKSGFNWFDLEGQWRGFMPQTAQAGSLVWSSRGEWMGSLQAGSAP